MRLAGKIEKDGKWWLASIPMIDAGTQGKTRKEALFMVKDLVETLVNAKGFKVMVILGQDGRIEISSNDPRKVIALVLRRLRERRGLSVRDAAKLLGVNSPTAYSRYERGESVPSVVKLGAMIHSITGKEIVLGSGLD